MQPALHGDGVLPIVGVVWGLEDAPTVVATTLIVVEDWGVSTAMPAGRADSGRFPRSGPVVAMRTV